MRNFSSNVQTALAESLVDYYTLIDLNLNSDYYLTDYAANLTIGSNTYLSSSVLVEISPPRNSTVVDRAPYQIVLDDQSNEFQNEMRANIIGMPIRIRIGFFNSNGVPYTSESDLVTVYKGRVDSPTISNNMENKYATIEGSSPMADLDSTKPLFVSRDGMNQFSLTDTSFDKMFKNDVEVKWGKI